MNGAASVVETHLSVLHLTDGLVLKFKKAVRLPFVDFTSLEERRRACQEEVEANRRLSPDVYLGVADVLLDGQSVDAAAVLDHAVVMRRLPAERCLEVLVRQGSADLRPGLERLAPLLVSFHAGATRSPLVDEAGAPAAVMGAWRGCLDTLDGFAGTLVDGAVLQELRRLATRYVAGRALLYEQRIEEGRVCDGHGDLLAGDIYLLDDGPRVLDCIEFDRRLRHVDVAADVAFLAMDLERLGATPLAEWFLDAYQRSSGDRFPATLLENYLAQRAVVRAEVACLRAAQGVGADAAAAEARHLLSMAAEHQRRGRVALAVVSGLPGTGKSTLAAALGSRLRWPVVRSDEIRAAQGGAVHREPLLAARLPGAYDQAVTEQTYQALLARSARQLELGQPVVLDATFSDERWRRAVEEVARQSASDLLVLSCRCPPEAAARRMRRRLEEGGDLSGADEEVAAAMTAAGGAEPWAGALEVDSSGPPDQTLETALDRLRSAGY